MNTPPSLRHPLSLLALALAALAASVPAHAGADAGRDKARACAVCHGAMGMSTQLDAPNLAGQPQIYLAEQLRAYRSGRRVHDVMTVIAKPLTDADIDDLSAWFSSIAIELKAKP